MPVNPIPPVTPPSQVAGGTCSFFALDIIKQAMQEVNLTALDEPISASDSQLGLAKLNRMIDSWNADGRFLYTVNFTQWPITPNLQPHTIGPTGTWVVNQRPMKLVGAAIILNNVNPPIRYPMNVSDADWWENQRAYAVTGTLPTDVYYEPDWPNGSCFIWPVPITAYPMELETWTILNQVKLTDKICLPPGYLDAIILSLAVSLQPSFGQPPNALLIAMAQKAIQRIQAPNSAAPRIGTRDQGIPGNAANRAYFNYRSGMTR